MYMYVFLYIHVREPALQAQYVRLSMYVCARMHAQVHVHVCMWVGSCIWRPQNNLRCHLQEHCPPLLNQGLNSEAGLAGQ